MRAMLWPDEQISVISAAFEAAHRGQPTVLSVPGPPGMGRPRCYARSPAARLALTC
jgi:hypothetical protein